MQNKGYEIGELEFVLLYPPEGNTSVLEVADNVLGPFLHVSLTEDGDLLFEFFTSAVVAVTERKLKEIKVMARKKLSWTDLSSRGLEPF